MKKTLLALALLAIGAAASAQSISYSLTNVGAIDNHTRAVADVNGAPGTSFTVSRGEASASASGAVAMVGGSIGPLSGGIGALSGDSATRNVATSFNTSTGAGTGYGSSAGWADSATFGNASYSAPGQSLNLAGSTDTGSLNHFYGSDVGVIVGTNQDAGAFGSSHGSFAVSGYVASFGGVVVGAVADTKVSEAQAETFRLTFTGTPPVGMTQGVMSAHGAAAVDVSASFADPVH